MTEKESKKTTRKNRFSDLVLPKISIFHLPSRTLQFIIQSSTSRDPTHPPTVPSIPSKGTVPQSGTGLKQIKLKELGKDFETMSHRIYAWCICLHLVVFFNGFHVGKYTSPMDPYGGINLAEWNGYFTIFQIWDFPGQIINNDNINQLWSWAASWFNTSNLT